MWKYTIKLQRNIVMSPSNVIFMKLIRQTSATLKNHEVQNLLHMLVFNYSNLIILTYINSDF